MSTQQTTLKYIKMIVIGVGVSVIYPLSAANIQILNSNGQPLQDVVAIIENQESVIFDIQVPEIIDQVDKKFVPRVKVIHVGQSINFPNSDQTRHHVYSFSAANSFEIKLYKDTPANPVLFDHAGIVTLGCNIHDLMIGYVYVAKPNTLAFVSDEQGVILLPGNLIMDTTSKIMLWHYQDGLQPKEFQLQPTSNTNEFIVQMDIQQPVQRKSKSFGQNKW